MVAAGSISSWAEEASSDEGSSRSHKQSRQRGGAASRASPAFSYNSPGPEVRGGKVRVGSFFYAMPRRPLRSWFRQEGAL